MELSKGQPLDNPKPNNLGSGKAVTKPSREAKGMKQTRSRTIILPQ